MSQFNVILMRLLPLVALPVLLALAACSTLTMDDDNPPAIAPAATVTTTETSTTATTVVPMAAVPIATPIPATAPVMDMSATNQTVVGRQIENLRANLNTLKANVANSGERLRMIKTAQQAAGEKYFTSMASIQARLQAGTTPGNPRLVAQWQQASRDLEGLGQHIADMNGLSTEVASQASLANFILDSTRATYSLSGAVEEDHVNLGLLEDEVNQVVSQIGRAVNDLTRDVERQSNYLTTERRNLQALAVAINAGELYGASLGNMAARPTAPSMLPMAATDPNLLAMQPAPAGRVRSSKLSETRAAVTKPVKSVKAKELKTTAARVNSATVRRLQDVAPPAPPMPVAPPLPAPTTDTVQPLGQTQAQPETRAMATRTAPVPDLPVPVVMPEADQSAIAAPANTVAVVNSTKPFIVIKFDQPDIDYGQPLYQAMQQALQRNPYGSFEVVGVSAADSSAQAAADSNAARRNAEGVVRTLAQMGIPSDRMQMSTATQDGLTAPEVHIFLRP